MHAHSLFFSLFESVFINCGARFVSDLFCFDLYCSSFAYGRIEDSIRIIVNLFVFVVKICVFCIVVCICGVCKRVSFQNTRRSITLSVADYVESVYLFGCIVLLLMMPLLLTFWLIVARSYMRAQINKIYIINKQEEK